MKLSVKTDKFLGGGLRGGEGVKRGHAVDLTFQKVDEFIS